MPNNTYIQNLDDCFENYPLSAEKLQGLFKVYSNGQESAQVLVKAIIRYAKGHLFEKANEKLLVTQLLENLKYAAHHQQTYKALAALSLEQFNSAEDLFHKEHQLSRFYASLKLDFDKLRNTTHLPPEEKQAQLTAIKDTLDAITIILAYLKKLQAKQATQDKHPVKLSEQDVENIKKGPLFSAENFSLAIDQHIARIAHAAQEKANHQSAIDLMAKVQELKTELANQLTDGKGSWKTALYELSEHPLTLKQTKTIPAASNRSFSQPIQTQERFTIDTNDEDIVSFAGSTFTSSIPEQAYGKTLILDSIVSSGDTTAISDGYEHYNTLNSYQNEDISRTSGFAAKHLARLANAFSTAEDLYINLPKIFEIAGQEAKRKGYDKTASGALAKLFYTKQGKKAVVAGVGDGMIIQIDPIKNKIKTLVSAREYKNADGSISPVSVTEPFASTRMQRDIVYIDNENPQIIIAMTDGAWSELLPLLKQEVKDPISGEIYFETTIDEAKAVKFINKLFTEMNSNAIQPRDIAETLQEILYTTLEQKRRKYMLIQSALNVFEEASDKLGFEKTSNKPVLEKTINNLIIYLANHNKRKMLEAIRNLLITRFTTTEAKKLSFDDFKRLCTNKVMGDDCTASVQVIKPIDEQFVAQYAAKDNADPFFLSKALKVLNISNSSAAKEPTDSSKGIRLLTTIVKDGKEEIDIYTLLNDKKQVVQIKNPVFNAKLSSTKALNEDTAFHNAAFEKLASNPVEIFQINDINLSAEDIQKLNRTLKKQNTLQQLSLKRIKIYDIDLLALLIIVLKKIKEGQPILFELADTKIYHQVENNPLISLLKDNMVINPSFKSISRWLNLLPQHNTPSVLSLPQAEQAVQALAPYIKQAWDYWLQAQLHILRKNYVQAAEFYYQASHLLYGQERADCKEEMKQMLGKYTKDTKVKQFLDKALQEKSNPTGFFNISPSRHENDVTESLRTNRR